MRMSNNEPLDWKGSTVKWQQWIINILAHAVYLKHV